MVGWNREGVLFSCSLSLPKLPIFIFQRLIVNALKFIIIVINIFSGLYKPFQNETEPSLLSKHFPLPFHQSIKIGIP